MSALSLETAISNGTLAVESAKRDEVKLGIGDIDLKLVELSRAGDIAAFQKLVERYQKKAHSIALGMLGNFDDAEDVAQEAFVKVYRNLESFRGQSSFYTWLYRIVVNLCIDLSRKSYRRSEVSAGDDLESGNNVAEGIPPLSRGSNLVNPEDRLNQLEMRQQVGRAISSLSPQHRAVILLREVEGLSYAEISEAIGCSKGTVMSRIHHARKKLQSLLVDYFRSNGTNRELSLDAEGKRSVG